MKNNDIRKVKAMFSKKAVRYAQIAITYINPWDINDLGYTWEEQLEFVMSDILIDRSECTFELLEHQGDENAVKLALRLECLNYEVDMMEGKKA